MTNDRLDRVLGKFQKSGEDLRRANDAARAEEEAKRDRKKLFEEQWAANLDVLREQVGSMSSKLEGSGYGLELSVRFPQPYESWLRQARVEIVAPEGDHRHQAWGAATLMERGEISFVVHRPGSHGAEKRKPVFKPVTDVNAGDWSDWITDLLEFGAPEPS